MKKHNNLDYDLLKNCPWCGSASSVSWGNPIRGFNSVKCQKCELIYIQNRLTSNSLERYYAEYIVKSHQADHVLNQQRDKMYDLEYKLIEKHIRNKNVLDVGCSGGYFLDRFSSSGFDCYGVEYSARAAAIANEKHTTFHGDFSEMDFTRKFDLIIFRGVIEHIPYPKRYLEKADTLLNSEGLIYITSTPNSNAICCDLFKEQFIMHEPEAHLMHFSASHFDDYFGALGYNKILEHLFYEETPYANPMDDIIMVSKAIDLKRKGNAINFRSPAFWGNMMSLLYRKS